MRSFGIGFILANHVLSLLKNTKHSLLNHFPVHLLIICFLIKNLQEIDADLTSTKKLGTVEENIQHYKESVQWYKDEGCMYTDTDHPHPAIRLKLFQTFTSQYSSPLLFQGNRLSNIRQTQQKYNTNKEQLDELFLKFYGKN